MNFPCNKMELRIVPKKQCVRQSTVSLALLGSCLFLTAVGCRVERARRTAQGAREVTHSAVSVQCTMYIVRSCLALKKSSSLDGPCRMEGPVHCENHQI